MTSGAFIIAGIVAATFLIVAGFTIVPDRLDARFGSEFCSLLGFMACTIVAVLLATGPIVFVVLNSHDDRPCARYEYTWIKGVQYRTCAEHWEPTP